MIERITGQTKIIAWLPVFCVSKVTPAKSTTVNQKASLSRNFAIEAALRSERIAESRAASFSRPDQRRSRISAPLGRRTPNVCDIAWRKRGARLPLLIATSASMSWM
jgi:hypothetical protein